MRSMESLYFGIYLMWLSIVQQLSIYGFNLIYWDFAHIFVVIAIIFIEYIFNFIDKIIISTRDEKSLLNSSRKSVNMHNYLSKESTIIGILIVYVIFSHSDLLISDLARLLVAVGWYSRSTVTDNVQSRRKSIKNVHILSSELVILSSSSLVISASIVAGKQALFLTYISHIVPVVVAQPRELLFDRKMCVLNSVFAFCYYFLYLTLRLTFNQHLDSAAMKKRSQDINSSNSFNKLYKDQTSYNLIYHIERDLTENASFHQCFFYDSIMTLSYFIISLQCLTSILLADKIYIPVISAVVNLLILQHCEL